MLDDLGQHVTPEITDGSSASTLFNDIKHEPLQMGLFPKMEEKCLLDTCLLLWPFLKHTLYL